MTTPALLATLRVRDQKRQREQRERQREQTEPELSVWIGQGRYSRPTSGVNLSHGLCYGLDLPGGRSAACGAPNSRQQEGMWLELEP